MVAIIDDFTAEFSGPAICYPKSKSPTDRYSNRWGWLVFGQFLKKGFGGYAASLRMLPKWLSSV
jgi:hypothetical protein